jgi:hypothetical protein
MRDSGYLTRPSRLFRHTNRHGPKTAASHMSSIEGIVRDDVVRVVTNEIARLALQRKTCRGESGLQRRDSGLLPH